MFQLNSFMIQIRSTLTVVELEEVESAASPMVLNVVHMEDGGAVCADGVLGSPWKKVEVPYTPIGYTVSAP